MSSMALASTGVPALADSHPFTAKDLVTMARLSSPQVSPDGKSIAYVLRTTDLDANKGRTDLWMVGLDGKRNEPQATDHQPRRAIRARASRPTVRASIFSPVVRDRRKCGACRSTPARRSR